MVLICYVELWSALIVVLSNKSGGRSVSAPDPVAGQGELVMLWEQYLSTSSEVEFPNVQC